MLPRVNKFPGAALLCVAALLAAGSARADDPLPQPAAPKRYDALAAHSPFAPPTGPAPAAAATPTPPPGPSWSDNLVVTSIMQNGNDYSATVMAKDTSARFLVRSGIKREDNDLELANVTWADKPEAIKITLRKGTQLGDVHFDASAASASVPAPGLPGRAPVPPVNFHPPPGVPGGLPNPPGGQPPNVVRGRPVIRANPPPIPGGQPGRPVINAPNPIVRAPAKPGGDDDDDDD